MESTPRSPGAEPQEEFQREPPRAAPEGVSLATEEGSRGRDVSAERGRVIR
ncbi:hypothetical protein N9188_00745 [bacterium]|nr:hypothetical protein [bacterium]